MRIRIGFLFIAAACCNPSGAARQRPFHGSLGVYVILSCSKFRGKNPRKPKRFSWSVQGGPGGNRNPPGLVFFCQRFLLEKQKKMLNSSRKFLRRVLTLINVSLSTRMPRLLRRGSMERYRQVCRIHRIICAWLHSSSAIFSSMQRCVPAFSASASYASCAACSSE